MAGRLATATATALLFIVIVVTVRQDRSLVLERSAPRAMVATGVAGCAAMVIAAWLFCRPHPFASIGIALVVAGLVIPSAAAWVSLPPPVRATCLAAMPLALAGIGSLGLGWDPARRSVTVATVAALSLAAVLLHVAGYNPFDDTACRRVCLDVAPVAGRLVSTRVALLWSQALSVMAGVALVISMLWTRRARPLPVTAGALVAAIALTFAAARRWRNVGGARLSPIAELLPSTVAAVAIGSTMCAVAVKGWRTRAGIVRLADRLAEPQTAFFGRPVRGIHVVVPDDGRWVDLAGHNVSAEAGGAALVVADEAGPAMRLLLARGADPAEVRAGFSPVMWFSLLNARLAAIARARVLDVAASRRRVVAAADAERRRIERDLHDGAQQRLVSASFYLRLARGRSSESGPQLAAAERGVHRALVNLRELSHGVFPRAIVTEGLPAALEDLVRESDALATLEVSGDCSTSEESAHAVYAAVLAALAAAQSSSTPTQVTVTREGPRVVATILSPAAVPDLAEVPDRVGAAGGHLSIVPASEGTLMTVDVPCG